MRRAVYFFVVAFAGCAAQAPQQDARPVGRQAETGDVVRLKSGESFSGKVVSINSNDVAIETGGRVRLFPKREVVEISRSVEVAVTPTETVRTTIPPSTWYPRVNSRDPILQVEVTFCEPHPFGECTGLLAKSFEEAPEFSLFVEPGGKLRVQDPRRWGYHAHILPGDAVRKPVDRPGLVIPVGPETQAVALVSPAQEMKPADGAPRVSYAVPDAVYARVREMSAAEATLSAQPFAGRPRETKLGGLWAFALPRNDRQFVLYLLDPARKHPKVLEEAYAAYGDALLAPDLLIDTLGPDGAVVGRVLVLPMPQTISADGPAPEPVTVLTGAHGIAVTTVAVPPRQAVLLPPRAPSTKADIHLSCYETSRAIPERLITAFGTGRPSGAVVRSRELTPEKGDEVVRIDLSSLKPEQFPAVAWFYHRRSYVWKDGGFLGEAAAVRAPAGAEGKPAKVISNAGRIPHVLPILFVGPEASKPAPDLLDSEVAGGMSNALLSDALGREAGTAFQALSTLSNVVPRGSGETPTSTERGGAQSVTNIYITIPPHTSMTDPGGFTTGGGIPTGPGLYYDPRNWGGQNVGPYLRRPPGGRSPLEFGSVLDSGTGTVKDRSGRVVYDPATGATSSDSGSYTQGDITFTDPWTGAGISLKRKKRP